MPLLSLCVPTFRRSQLLNQSLSAILSQIEPPMTDMVEVLVLDNASPDDTPSVVAQAQADFPHMSLRSLRHPENIGPDANFFEARNLANGKFVYLISDDDVLLPGAVARLLELIQAYPKFDAFSLNVRQFWDDPYQEDTPQVYKFEGDRILANRDEALLLLKAHIIFISCIAFRRENVQDKNYDNRRGTNMGQSYMFLDALMPGHGMYVTSQSYLAQRAEHAEGYNFFSVWVTNFRALMKYAQQTGYAPETVQQVCAATLPFVRQFVLKFKENGHYDQLRLSYTDGLLRLLRAYGLNRFVLLYIIPILLTPRPIFGRVQSQY
jgi:glycosyltransferase involved in cell wall biosynthesis